MGKKGIRESYLDKRPMKSSPRGSKEGPRKRTIGQDIWPPADVGCRAKSDVEGPKQKRSLQRDEGLEGSLERERLNL